jgi:hypothetical protein
MVPKQPSNRCIAVFPLLMLLGASLAFVGVRAGQATEPQGTSVPITQFANPDVYELEGGGISVTYLLRGVGGLPHLTYRDALRTLNFSADQIRAVEVPDLGTIVSVTIVSSVDSGTTTFSLVIPIVKLPIQRGGPTPISTEGITTVHKSSILPEFNQGQREVYAVTTMTGTATIITLTR